MSKKIKSDGGKNNFYKFPKWVNDIDSLARYWKLSFAEGNVLKSLAINLGNRHDGTNPLREKRKALHYAVDRLLADDNYTPDQIVEQVLKQLDYKDKIRNCFYEPNGDMLLVKQEECKELATKLELFE